MLHLHYLRVSASSTGKWYFVFNWKLKTTNWKLYYA